MSETFPLHVRVHAVLEPASVFELEYRQNISLPPDGGSFPSPRPRGLWVTRHYLAADHDCAYRYYDEPCECRTTWTQTVPLYDLLWSDGGYLIDKYVRYLERIHDDGPVAWGARWWSLGPNFDEVIGNGPTVLIAVCNLILELGPERLSRQ